METQYDIEIMTQVTGMLRSLPREGRSRDYTKILELVDAYLLKHCKHVFVTDYIEMDAERGQNIQYCEKCYVSSNP